MKTRFPDSVIPRLFLTGIIGFIPFVALPQEITTCAENLKNAQTLFDNGQVGQVPGMLAECLESGFNREEELSAYKLIIQTYLFEDRLEEADSAMLAFLKRNPEYQLSPTDHSSFVHLFNNFSVKPVVQLVLRIGTNLPFLTFIDPRTLSSEEASAEYSSDALNLFGSIEAKFALSSRLELNTEVGYSQSSFTKTEEFLGFGIVNYSEIQHRLEIPLTATFNVLNFGKFTAYTRAGSGAALNLASTAKKMSFEESDLIDFDNHEGPEIPRNDSRIKLDVFGQVGAGIKFKTRGGYFNFEVRSNMGVFNQTIRGGDSAETTEYDYNYIDDGFNLNNLNFSFGYTQIFYKSSKRE